jgi:hypothetical protein
MMKNSLLLRLTVLSLLLVTATSATAESLKPLKGEDSLGSVTSQPADRQIDKPIENSRAAKDNNIQCTTTGNSVSCSGSTGTSPEAARDAREVLEHADEF